MLQPAPLTRHSVVSQTERGDQKIDHENVPGHDHDKGDKNLIIVINSTYSTQRASLRQSSFSSSPSLAEHHFHQRWTGHSVNDVVDDGDAGAFLAANDGDQLPGPPSCGS